MDLSSKPYFVLQEEELINACQDRLGRSYEVCSDLFSTGYAIDEEVRLHRRSWGPDSDIRGSEPSGTCLQIPGIKRLHQRSWGPNSDKRGSEPSGTGPQIPGINRILKFY